MANEFLDYTDKTVSFVPSDTCSFLLAGGKGPDGLGRIFQVADNGKVFIADLDIERIAQRVAELLKPQPNIARGL